MQARVSHLGMILAHSLLQQLEIGLQLQELPQLHTCPPQRPHFCPA